MGTILDRILNGSPGVDRRTVRKLSECVEALICGAKLGLTDLGRNLGRPILRKHSIKAVDRLLGDSKLHAKSLQYYNSIAKHIIGNQKVVRISVDLTESDGDYKIVTAAVSTRGRAIPILSRATKKKMPGVRFHKRFLKDLREVLPETCKPIVIADAGFRGTWVKAVEAHGFKHVTRLRHNTFVRYKGFAKWLANKSLHKRADNKPRKLGSYDVGKTGRYEATLVLFKQVNKCRPSTRKDGKKRRSGKDEKHRQSRQEPWLLATNTHLSAREVVAIYEERMKIEETFRDFKSWRDGFGFRYSRARSAQRVELLFLIGTLAFLACSAVGLAGERAGMHRGLQANTSKKRQLSIMRVGRALLAGEHTPLPKTEEVLLVISELCEHAALPPPSQALAVR